MEIESKSKLELGHMRDAGRVVAETLELLAEAAKPGVSLNDLDRIAARNIERHKAVSSFLGYKGYPKVLCASVNEVVVHGIPSDRRLVEGDIVGLDFGVSLRGYHADAARTVGVGKISEARQRLLDTTRDALAAAVASSVPGSRLGDIGATVQQFVESRGYAIVRDFVGHGIGRRMHEEPQVPNYGAPGRGRRLRAGWVLAIEPMVNEGTFEVDVLEDGWTVVTKDSKDSAHFENTVAITDNGPEVLTRL